ncbi:MAG: GAF domain-containing protein [Anaerolineae bacterium]
MPPRSHVIVTDSPAQIHAIIAAEKLDLAVVRLPKPLSDDWRQAISRAQTAARLGVVVITHPGAETNLGFPVTALVDSYQEHDLAETIRNLLSQADKAASSSAVVSTIAQEPMPTPDAAARTEVMPLVQTLTDLALGLEAGENLAHFLEEVAVGLQSVLSCECVELELTTPNLRASAPRHGHIPPAVDQLKEFVLATGTSAQYCQGTRAKMLIFPLRSPRHDHGTLTLAHSNEKELQPALLPTLQLFAGHIARVLDNSRLLLEHRRNLDEMQAIADIGRTMVVSFNLERILDMIVHTALRFIPEATRAVIHLLNETQDSLLPKAQAGDPVAPAQLILPWGHGIAGKVAAERRTIYVPDVESDPDFVIGNTLVGSLNVAPLLVGQAVIGTISVSSPARNAFSERDTRILASLASQAAVAIESARLHNEVRKADEVAALYELSQALNTSLDLQETVTTILSSARSLTFASAAEVRLTSSVDETLETVIALGDRPQSAPGDRYRMSVLYPRLVLERRKPLLVENTIRFELNDEFCRHELPSWLHSYLGIPLIANQRVVGILSLGSERTGAFTSEDLRLLEIVAGQAATSLNNARLYEEATRRLREAEALAKVSRNVAANLEQTTLLHAVVNTALQTLPLAHHCFAYLLSDDCTPVLAAVAPDGSRSESSFDVSIWEWCADGCLVKSQPVQVDDTLRQGFPTASPSVAHSVVAVPMVAAGKVVGILGADSTLPEAFAAGDVRLLETFADQAATAIESARLFTDLNRAYRDLAQSTETLTAVFNGISDGMYIVDRHDRLVMMNGPEAAAHGGQPESFANTSYSSLYHYSEGHCEHCTVCEALATGEHRSVLVSYTNDEGHQVWREVDAYPIRDREGITDRVVVFARDVTARRRMEASLYESSKLASIGQLASNIAHEVNNPLTIIVGNAEVLLLDTTRDDAERETVEMILRAAQRAARIVQNVLNLSSQREYEFAEVDIETNLQEAIELVAHPLRKAGIQPSLIVAPDVPLILASANHLKVVWMNLLLNARDAIVRAQRHYGSIEIQARTVEDGGVSVAISDNGIGIEESEREKLFQPFHTTKPPGGGLGLGLYSAYNIVNQHRGRIEVNTKPGEGTTFTVYLPSDPEIADAPAPAS